MTDKLGLRTRVQHCAVLAAICVGVGSPFAHAQEAPTMPQAPSAWRGAAQSDLQALHRYLRDDTPVAVDGENPRMQRWFELGYRQAQARVRRVTDWSSYFYALAAYVNGFRDPHLQLNPNASSPVARWPGFVVTARGADAVVHFRDDADANAPPLGAHVVSCDGASITRLREQVVFPFVLNPQLAADQRSSVPRLFLDRGNHFAPPPRRCVVQSQGTRRVITLKWRDVPQGDTFWTQFSQAALGPTAAFGVSSPKEGVTWIGVPTFGSNSGTQLRALIEQISANGELIRKGRAIVIDVRGNGGGASEWGVELARAVWGAPIIDALEPPNRASATDWRVSPGNRDYFNSFAPKLIEQFGAASRVGQWAAEAQRNLTEAVTRGDEFWRAREPGAVGAIAQGGGHTERRPRGPSPIPARVYVLSNGTCASACLDFADIALHVPGVQLIGADTSADGLLMEVRNQALPSGLSRLVLPIKVIRGRGRGAMEAYRADVAYGGVWTDEDVRAWALALIAAQ